MKKETSRIERLEYVLLKSFPNISHGTFLRRGGASKKPFDMLNVSLSVGDDPDHVVKNREAICKTLRISSAVYAKAVHGSDLFFVTKENGSNLPQCDALFTNEKGLGIGISHADCQAAIFYDPVHKVIGVVHAGWRGLVQNIYAKGVDFLTKRFGTKADELIVCISPSIGPDHAEYKNYIQDFPKSFWEYQVKPNYFDFWAIAKKQLMECGVLQKNLEITKTCTHCNRRDYFSYRRDKQTGRHATVVTLI